jgi:hypothetical protein
MYAFHNVSEEKGDKKWNLQQEATAKDGRGKRGNLQRAPAAAPKCGKPASQ